ncbi:extensin, partial [Streptomyces albiflaviniger]|nr:extensin [Streptomyces albiflaviniger]
MGRHSRPTAAQQARTTTLKAATALGVAGTIAFGLHSTLGGDKSVEARSDVNAQQAQTPDEVEPTADHSPSQSHVSPSESSKPKLISDHTDAATP